METSSHRLRSGEYENESCTCVYKTYCHKTPSRAHAISPVDVYDVEGFLAHLTSLGGDHTHVQALLITRSGWQVTGHQTPLVRPCTLSLRFSFRAARRSH